MEEDMYENMYAELANPSFGDTLLSQLLSCGSMQIQRQALYDIIASRYHKNKATYNTELSRLKKKGYIKYDRETVMLKDREFVVKHLLPNSKRPVVDKNIQLIIMFDIPENIRGMRHWIRSQLKLWGFTKMQQSVWSGYGPLPKEFIDEIKKHKLQKYIQVLQSKKMHTLRL
ncbi:MAG: hypothetical protein KBB88_00820 [Candidatus Pacebacteria bacterium]|nr:hypothetical protein [Candidatus Paceibacterota bacterium]